MARTQPAIGIDFGTSHSCVGIWKNGSVEIVVNELGERTTPSYIGFTDTGRLFGTSASNQAKKNTQNTIFDIKRLIGGKFNNPIVRNNMELWPFTIIETAHGRPAIQVSYNDEIKRFCVEEIISMILQYLKNNSQKYLGINIENAVICTPACFNTTQRQAIKDAGTIAGLNILRVIDESTAAGITYAVNKYNSDDNNNIDRNVLIFDLGGGTLSISLLSVNDDVIEVKATGGNIHLGGQDFTNILLDYLIKEFKTKYRLDLTKSYSSMIRLLTQCERAKIMLSVARRTNIDIDNLYQGIDFMTTITRSTFEDLCIDLFRNCLDRIETVLKNGKMSKSDIDDVVLIGGSTRIPMIQDMIKQYFNGKELCKSINTDEAVAYGAAINAAILSQQEMGYKGNILLIDVISLSLGVETEGGVMTKLIERNRTIPCKAYKTITVYGDKQSRVLINIFEGDQEETKENNFLSQLELEGQPDGGAVQVEVVFDIDTGGTLSVTAQEKENEQNVKQITVGYDQLEGNLSKNEIDILKFHARQYMLDDEKHNEKINEMIDVQNYAYKVKEKLEQVNEVVGELLGWIDINKNCDIQQLHIKKKELQDALLLMVRNVGKDGELVDNGRDNISG